MFFATFKESLIRQVVLDKWFPLNLAHRELFPRVVQAAIARERIGWSWPQHLSETCPVLCPSLETQELAASFRSKRSGFAALTPNHILIHAGPIPLARRSSKIGHELATVRFVFRPQRQ